MGSQAGKVKRFIKIKYEAELVDGIKVEGIAEGYLARVIQHEVDHLHGILFIDKTSPDKMLSLEEYQRIRNAKMEQ